MIKYFKNAVVLLALLMVPMNIASKANPEDEHGLTRRHITAKPKVESLKVEDSNGAGSAIIRSTSLENVEDQPTSWGSYLASPAKRFVQGTANVVNFATEGIIQGTVNTVKFTAKVVNFAVENPRLATVVGLSYLIPAVAAGCHCYCQIPNGSERDMGCLVSDAICRSQCAFFDWQYVSCYDDGC